MKKIFILFMLAIGVHFAKAQTSGAIVTTVPSSFTAEDRVKIIINVSNVGNLKGKEPLYMWTWDPGDPAPGNGAWDNSNEARKLTKEGTDLWSITFKPTEFYVKTPAEITQIQFLVKAKSGNGDAKTDDIKIAVAPLVYTPTVFRTFPRFASQNDYVFFYLDQSLATDATTQRMNVTGVKAQLLDATNGVIDTEKTVPLVKTGTGLYSTSFLPSKVFTIPPGKLVSKVKFTYSGTILDVNGVAQPVTSVFEKVLDNLK